MDFGTPKVTNFLFFWVLKRECPSGGFFVKFGEHDKTERERADTDRERAGGEKAYRRATSLGCKNRDFK